MSNKREWGGVIGAAAGAIAGAYGYGNVYTNAYYGFSIGYGVGPAVESKPGLQGPRLDDLCFANTPNCKTVEVAR